MIKLQTWKTLFTIARKNEWWYNQSDIVTVFLYNFLDKEIYVQQSLDLEQRSELVYLLKKTLYDLKQLLWVWFNTLCKFLKNLDFMQSDYDHSMFIAINKFMIITIYVDDILIFKDNDKNIKKIQDSLSNWFKMTDLEKMSHYLDMEINIDNNKTSIH